MYWESGGGERDHCCGSKALRGLQNDSSFGTLALNFVDGCSINLTLFLGGEGDLVKDGSGDDIL